jgi:hypothetical protein
MEQDNSKRALEDESKAAESKVRQLKKSKILEAHKGATDILNKWRVKLEKIDDNKDPKNYELSIYPHVMAQRSPLDCMHYVNLVDNDDKSLWSYTTYKCSDAGGVPWKKSGPTIESLMPEREDVWNCVGLGIRYLIKPLKENKGLMEVQNEAADNAHRLSIMIQGELDITRLDIVDLRNLQDAFPYVSKERFDLSDQDRRECDEEIMVPLLNRSAHIASLIKEMEDNMKHISDHIALLKKYQSRMYGAYLNPVQQ